MLFSSTGIVARASSKAVDKSIRRGWSVIDASNTSAIGRTASVAISVLADSISEPRSTLEPSSGKRSLCGVWTWSMPKSCLFPLGVPLEDNARSPWVKGRSSSIASSKFTLSGRDRPDRLADSTRGTELSRCLGDRYEISRLIQFAAVRSSTFAFAGAQIKHRSGTALIV